MALRFLDTAAAATVANIVVDGAAQPATVLTLTHWPGAAQPANLAADLSAQMAFRFIHGHADDATRAAAAEALGVTNNHFDQDGLVAMFALLNPAEAIANESLLIDVAAAGDFATYTDRRAARASMAIAAYTDPTRSPIADRLGGDDDEQCAALYPAMLDVLLTLALDPQPFADLWAEEDAYLTMCEQAIAAGEITIEEHRAQSLAVVTVPAKFIDHGSHRFGGQVVHGIHPMAVNNATGCVRILECGRSIRYTDRYETWVQYRSRPLPQRVDLQPLAARLSELDSGGPWRAQRPSALTPTMTSPAVTSLAAATVVGAVIEHLDTSPPAWDPYHLTGR